MKPLSIKIDQSLPQSVQEGWVKAFQEHCFSKKIGWPELKILYLERVEFMVNQWHSNKLTITWGIDPCTDSEPFTLSTPQDFEAFKYYLDKYIAHYKPEPKVGEIWYDDYRQEPVEILYPTETGYKVKYASGIKYSLYREHLNRKSPPEEITQFRNTQLLREAKERYPAGTRVEDAGKGNYNTGILTGEFSINCFGEIDGATKCGSGITVKNDRGWAEVIPEKEEKQEEKCCAGCKSFTGGEMKHHKDCPYYPDSISKTFDLQSERIKELEEALRNLLNCFTSEYRSNWPEVKTANKLLNQQ